MPSRELKEFRSFILDAIAHSVLILGDRCVMHGFYWCLERLERVKRGKIPFESNVLNEFMEELFHEGTNMLKRRITKNLCGKTGLPFKEHVASTLVQCCRISPSRVFRYENSGESGVCQGKRRMK